jgi:DNA-binding transcriptional LysR family regulator
MLELTQRKIDISKLRLFYEVAKEKNLTRAAYNLHMSQPALSKAIIYLEERMNLTLFERTSLGMRLTTYGESLYLHAKEVLEKHELFQRSLFEKTEELSGDLRISSYPYLGTIWLIPLLKDFCNKHKHLKLKIRTDTENISPIYTDVAIGSFILNQPFLIQEKLSDNFHNFYASKEYLSKYGTPQKSDDLDHHKIIAYREDYYSPARSTNVLRNIGSNIRSSRAAYIELDSLQGLISATQAGLGISELPSFIDIQKLGLVRVLPEIQGENVPIYFIIHEKMKDSKKIKSLNLYIKRKLNI